MKKILFLSLLLPVVIGGYAQKATPVEIGKFTDGRVITAMQFKPANEIVDASIDTATQEVLMVLMKKPDGWDRMAERVVLEQALFDIKTNTVRWTKDFPVYEPCRYVYSKKHFIRTSVYKSTCYDKANGKPRWEARVPIQMISEKANVAVSFRGGGYDLNTGERKWYREFGPVEWRDYTYVNENTLVVASDALHYVRLTDGKGWDFEGTSKRGFSEFGRYGSNVMERNGKIYFATSNHMYCLDTMGTVVWQHQLPDKTASVSQIEFNEKYVIMTNYGTGWSGGKSGAAFLAAWHIDNGEQKYLQMIEPKDKIVDVYTNGTSNVMMCSKHVYLYNVYNGEKVIDVKIKGTPYQEYTRLLYPYFCLINNNEGNFVNVSEAYPDHSFWMSPRDESILRSDHRMRPVDTIAADKWWALYQRRPNYCLVRKDGTSALVRDGKKFAALYFNSASIVGNKLVSIEHNNIKVVDMKGWF